MVANQPMDMPARSTGGVGEGRTVRADLQLVRHPARLPGGHPGFLPGVEEEKIGIIKRGGRFIFAFVEAPYRR